MEVTNPLGTVPEIHVTSSTVLSHTTSFSLTDFLPIRREDRELAARESHQNRRRQRLLGELSAGVQLAELRHRARGYEQGPHLGPSHPW